jgi:hypothetical protein
MWMKKGQISIDLMLTVIVAILLSQVFSTFTSELIKSERTTAIKAQEENIANDLVELIHQAKMLDELGDSNFAIYYKPSMILDPEKRGGQDCNIFVLRTTPEIEISYEANDLNTISVERELNAQYKNWVTPLEYNCKQGILLTQEEIGEKIV